MADHSMTPAERRAYIRNYREARRKGASRVKAEHIADLEWLIGHRPTPEATHYEGTAACVARMIPTRAASGGVTT